MSFIFSAALEEAFSQACHSGTARSAPSSGSPMHKPCLWHDKTMAPSRLSRFGITCSPLTGDRGVELLTWWLEVSRVKTFPSPDQARGSTVSEADSGARWPGSLARYDRATSSWKTAQLSLLGDSEPSSVTWPRSGLMHGGQCWELPRLTLTTTGKESGYWPTPTANSVTERTQRYAQGGMPLTAAVRMFPTPTATSYKGWSINHKRADSDDRLDYTVEREAFISGQTTPPKRLNPDWVEWLIGWPIGHTALKPLETDKFREWQRQHGGCSMSGELTQTGPAKCDDLCQSERGVTGRQAVTTAPAQQPAPRRPAPASAAARWACRCCG